MDIEEYISRVISKVYEKDKTLFLLKYLDLDTFEKMTIKIHYENVGIADSYLFYTFPFWKSINYENLLNIFYRFILIHKKGSLFGFECFMNFFYIFLKVDLIKVYAETTIANQQLRDWVLEGYIKGAGSLFYYLSCRNTFEEKLRYYDLSYETLEEIGQKFINQGAYKADKIPYINEVYNYDRAVGIPNNWKAWAKEYKNK
ncbi:hypothetical protein [Hugenholtzia roseola]|uniref:hypothetical protein n=1 Tax=Hugenholtzia roseola TaxID=1002 RepID=UPI0012B565C2|nr:hypothetical protein [Hugenholtzia roseola]